MNNVLMNAMRLARTENAAAHVANVIKKRENVNDVKLSNEADKAAGGIDLWVYVNNHKTPTSVTVFTDRLSAYTNDIVLPTEEEAERTNIRESDLLVYYSIMNDKIYCVKTDRFYTEVGRKGIAPVEVKTGEGDAAVTEHAYVIGISTMTRNRWLIEMNTREVKPVSVKAPPAILRSKTGEKFSSDVSFGSEMETRIMDYFTARPNIERVEDVSKDEKWQDADVDLLVYNGRPSPVRVEIKSDRKMCDTGNIAFEVLSDKDLRTPGCLIKTQSDVLFYCDSERNICYRINTKPLRNYVKENKTRLRKTNMGDNALGYLVPIEELFDKPWFEVILLPVRKVC